MSGAFLQCGGQPRFAVMGGGSRCGSLAIRAGLTFASSRPPEIGGKPRLAVKAMARVHPAAAEPRAVRRRLGIAHG